MSSRFSNPHFISWIDGLIEKGLVCNPYTDHWFAHMVDPTEVFCSFAMDDPEPQVVGHLLILRAHAIPDLSPLLNAVPKARELFDVSLHTPDYVFINLVEDKVLCIGLGRKNEFFAFNGDTKKSYKLESFDDPDEWLESFLELDTADFVTTLSDTLAGLGEFLFEFMETPGNIDTCSQALNNGPDECGYYHIEGEDDDYTLEEIEEFQSSHEEAKQGTDAAMATLKIIFPEEEAGDLNTGDC